MDSNTWNKNILFVDNENKNWIGDMDVFSEVIGFVDVDSETPNQLLDGSEEGFELTGVKKNRFFNEKYLSLFADANNTYAAYINNMKTSDTKTASTSYFDKAYPNNGIDVVMPELSDWIDAHSGDELNENSCLLFDWDRTITVVEGMLFGKNNDLIDSLENGTVTFDDLLMFIMSSSERIESIRNMFEKIINSGISVYILTHNSNASKNAPSRRIYVELLKRLTGLPEERIEDILFSSVDNSKYKKKLSACKTPIERIRAICDRMAESETTAVAKPPTYAKTKATTEPMEEDAKPKNATKRPRRGGYKSKKIHKRKNKTNRRKNRMGSKKRR